VCSQGSIKIKFYGNTCRKFLFIFLTSHGKWIIFQKNYKNNDNDRCIINMSDDNQRLFKVLDVFESKNKTHFRNLQIWGFLK